MRYRSLDGLRGIAALIVVVHHSLLTSAPLADAYYAGRNPRPHGLDALITWSPLHLFWAGGEAVLVFFVLSGFVLTVAADGNWRGYYPRRLVRLYVPVWAALAIGFPCMRFIWPGHGAESWWLQSHTGSEGLKSLIADATLLRHPGATISPIWSLEWEVWFSLLLPLYLLLTRIASRRLAVAAGGMLIALVEVGYQTHVRWLTYMPIFGLGVLLARHRGALTSLAARFGTVLLAVGLLLLIAGWTVEPLGLDALKAVTRNLVDLGAVLVVVGFLAGPVAIWSASSRVVQWLGKRSFSLYLIHEPVLVSVALFLHAPLVVNLIITLPLCLAAAEVFGRLVEGPAHRLSKRVGAMSSRVREPLTGVA